MAGQSLLPLIQTNPSQPIQPTAPGQSLLPPSPRGALSNEDWFQQKYGRPVPQDMGELDDITGGLSVQQFREREDPEGLAAWNQFVGSYRDWYRERSGQPPLPAINESPNLYDPGVNYDNITRSAGQAVFSLGDEIAGVGAGLGAILNPNDPRNFGEAYQETVDAERMKLDAFRQINPGASAAAEIIPSMIPIGGPIAWASKGGNWVARGGRATLAGGGVGAAYGYGAGEGGPFSQDRFDSALQFSWPSAITAGGANVLAPLIARGTAGIYNAVTNFRRGTLEAAPGVNPAANNAMANQFGIDLTRGQAYQNLTQAAREQDVLRGVRGDEAQRILQGAMETQNQAIQEAARNIAADLSGPLGRPVPYQEAGELATLGMQRVAAEARANADRLYAEARQLNPLLEAGHAESIPWSVTSHLVNDNDDFLFDEVLHPTAFRAMQEVDNLTTFARPDGTLALTDIERIRRRLIQMQGSTDADNAALRKVVQAYDAAVFDMVDDQLFSGDPRALAALVEARAEWTRYRSYTRPLPSNQAYDAAQIIQRMVEKDVTPEEVANWVYGATLANPPARANRVASTLKDILGPTSEEWMAVRSAAFTRLVTQVNNPDEILTAARMATNITGFVNGRGQSLANTLFTAEEREMLLSFANTLRLIAPPKGALNASGTSYAVMRQLAPIAQMLGGGLNLSVGNIPGAVLSLVGVPAARNISGLVAARRAINPTAGQPLFQNPDAAERVLGHVLGTFGVSTVTHAETLQ